MSAIGFVSESRNAHQEITVFQVPGIEPGESCCQGFMTMAVHFTQTMSGSNTPRVPFLTAKDQLPEDQQHNYDLIVETRGRIIGPFGVLLNSPEIAGRVGSLGAYLRFESELPGSVRELAIIATSKEFDCPFEWTIHEPLARTEGVSEAAIDAVEKGNAIDHLDEDEALIISYCQELFRRNEVSDRTFEAVRGRFGNSGVTELTATIGYYAMLAAVLNALEVLPDDGEPMSE